jgi:hypothetical protein
MIKRKITQSLFCPGTCSDFETGTEEEINLNKLLESPTSLVVSSLWSRRIVPAHLSLHMTHVMRPGILEFCA